METGDNLNKLDLKGVKITLKGYYKNLPSPSYPKSEFINKLAEKCGVTTVTVRNWILYGFRPDNMEHVRIISEETGIPAEELWTD